MPEYVNGHYHQPHPKPQIECNLPQKSSAPQSMTSQDYISKLKNSISKNPSLHTKKAKNNFSKERKVEVVHQNGESACIDFVISSKNRKEISIEEFYSNNKKWGSYITNIFHDENKFQIPDFIFTSLSNDIGLKNENAEGSNQESKIKSKNIQEKNF